MSDNSKNLKYELPGHRIKILGAAIFGLLLFLAYSIIKADPEISFTDFLMVPLMAIVALWFKRFLSRYSNVGFLLSRDGLCNLDKSLICKIEDIERIDVSPYTFKSANGFIVFSKTKSSFNSVPGLYWQLGNRISIGGLVSKNESKLLSGTLLSFFEDKNQKSSEH